MKVPDEMLMAYADGELDAVGRSRVEAAMAEDPELARRVAAHEALRGTLATGFGAILDEPVPERLLAAVRSGQVRGQVLPFRREAGSPRRWLQWGALAASFVLGALVWHSASRLFLSGSVVDQNGQLMAAGPLARTLSNQLAAEQTPGTPARITVSFISKGGEYCRAFQLQESAGLACQRNAQWHLEVLTHVADESTSAQFRQAASTLPPAVLQAVSDSIAGEPLDAAAEARARAQQWRPR